MQRRTKKRRLARRLTEAATEKPSDVYLVTTGKTLQEASDWGAEVARARYLERLLLFPTAAGIVADLFCPQDLLL